MPSSEEIAAQLAALQQQLAEAQEYLAPLKDSVEELNSQKYMLNEMYRQQMAEIRKEHEAKLAEVNAVKQAKDDAFAEAQAKVYNLINNANYYENQLKQAQEAEEAAKKAVEEAKEAQQKAAEAAAADKALTERWDLLTAAAPWREWAKDHQISGAHFVTSGRYVIVADPMGLGKTLTLIATNDMAESATREASPQWPFLGIEKEVYVSARWINDKTHEVKQGYIQYDAKKKMEDDPDWTFEPGHYENQIVDSITRPVGRKVLYICPAPLLRNVMAEYHRWSPHRNVTFIGSMPKASRDYFLDNMLPTLADCVVIVNYEAWRKDHSLLDKLDSYRFDTVVIDEAHMTKNQKTSAFRGVERLVNGPNHRPEYVVPMTGTPVLNRPQELFPMLHFTNPSDFREENDFLRNYCEQYEDSNGVMRWRFREGGLTTLQHKIGKNFLRRTKDQAGIILPPKTILYHDLDVDEDLFPLQAKARMQMRKYATIIINQAKGLALSATVKIALITRLRQIETWPAGIIQYETYIDEKGNKQFVRNQDGSKKILMQLDVKESQKVDYCIHWDETNQEWDGLIPEIVEDERVVVFSQFKAPLLELADRINQSGKRAIFYPGTSNPKLSDEIRIDFDATYTPADAEYKWDVVLCSYKAGGVGLNLTAASQLISLDDEWNPGKRDQAFDRIHRIGQVRPATIHVVRDAKTIDDWMASIMADKEDIVDGFNTKMEDTITSDDLLKAIESGLI